MAWSLQLPANVFCAPPPGSSFPAAASPWSSGKHSPPVSTRCTHVKGHGGAKAAVRQVLQHLPANRFVLGTDVKAYYSSIDHFLLLDQLAEIIRDKRVLNLALRHRKESGASLRSARVWRSAVILYPPLGRVR